MQRGLEDDNDLPPDSGTTLEVNFQLDKILIDIDLSGQAKVSIKTWQFNHILQIMIKLSSRYLFANSQSLK